MSPTAARWRLMTLVAALLRYSTLLAVLENVHGGAGTDEERLMIYLENRTNPNMRPVNFANETVKVDMYMMLVDFNMLEQSETLEIYSRIYLEWTDPNIQWNRDEYPDQTWISLPQKKIWSPQIKLLNSHRKDGTIFKSSDARNVLVSDEGMVWVTLRTKLTVPCALDLTNFPYDKQTCYLNFSSTIYSSKEMDFNPSSYVSPWWEEQSKYSQWTLLGSNILREVVPSPAGKEGSGDNYTVAMVELIFQRVPTYYSFVYIIPMVVASLLTVSTFVLPSGNQQKVTLGSGLLVLHSIMFLELGVILAPFHATIPLLDEYYMAMYAILALSILFSTVTMNLTRGTGGATVTPPHLFRQFTIEYLGRVLCLPYNSTEYNRALPTRFSNVNTEGSTPTNIDTASSSSSLKPEEQEAASDWLHMAAIFDRLLLVVYLVLTLVTTIAILKGITTTS